MKTLSYFPRPLVTVAPRDLLLLETLPTQPDLQALEIGTGSGSSLFRLARWVGSLHGVDISEGPVARLRQRLQQLPRPLSDVELFALDFCNPGAARALPGRYDLVFTCDTLEHVEKPAQFLANVYQALKPGGCLFLTYPNEHPERAHGITWFETRRELEQLLQDAGFALEDVQLDTLRMSRWAEQVFQYGWLWPRQLAKQAWQGLRGTTTGAAPPQTFENTDFFAAADRLERFSPVINAYCWGVLKMMSLARPVYAVEPAPETIWDRQILIRAVRRAGANSLAN